MFRMDGGWMDGESDANMCVRLERVPNGVPRF